MGKAVSLQHFRKTGRPWGRRWREKFIEGIEEASVVQENKRERSQFSQVTLRRYNKEKEEDTTKSLILAQDER